MVVVERIRRRPGAPVAQRKAAATVRPMSRDEIAAEIAEIKHDARRLRPPEGHDPERFHRDKSEHVRRIELLEDAVRQNRPLKRAEEQDTPGRPLSPRKA